jgi:hypothetical protein
MPVQQGTGVALQALSPLLVIEDPNSAVKRRRPLVGRRTHKYGNLYYCMKTKTTIELPDELVIAAKRQAAERRTTLRTLVERGLRRELRRDRRALKRAPIRWMTVDGGLPDGLDPANRAAMMDRLRRRS